jgi:hypothetical protein
MHTMISSSLRLNSVFFSTGGEADCNENRMYRSCAVRFCFGDRQLVRFRESSFSIEQQIRFVKSRAD